MKNIVLCADGTWNTPHGSTVGIGDTNVRKLYMALINSATQLKYYDSGVGTDGTPIDHLVGGAMGDGLFQKVQDCYSFLASVYDPGDSIYLFGFSRGAFTARSIAGMIAGFGVPTINYDNQTVSRIFAAYRETDPAARKALKAGLTETYGLTDVNMEMVGVWDTVGALGIPGLFFNALNSHKYGFLDTAIHPCIKKAFHAVAIDERRAQFAPTLWTNPDGTPLANNNQVEQVWFPGVHCDVGGSYPESALADITLSWMLRKAKEHGLILSPEAEAINLTPAPDSSSGLEHDSWTFVPYGFPKSRTVPSVANMSNTVQDRLDAAGQALPEAYAPENLTLENRQLKGYAITHVLPYQVPVWPV